MQHIVRVPSSYPEMEHAVEEIARTGEIVSVSSDGAGSLFVVVTSRKKRTAPGEKETRA